MANPIPPLSVYVNLDVEAFQKGMKRLARDLDSVAKKTSAIGNTLTAAVSAPLAAAGAAALKFSTDFNKAMANVASLVPGSTERVNELKSSVQQLAIATGKSTSDLADGLYQVISAFGDSADSVAVLETAAKTARAGLTSTTEAINLTAAVTKAYGDTSAAAVAKVADLAFKAVELGQTTFPELAASIGRVTPITKELGVSQEELFAVMATFTGVTGSAAEVSTQLRGALTELLSPSAALQKLYNDQNIAGGKALIAQRGLAGAINFVKDAADKAGLPLQKMIGSVEGQIFAYSIAGAQATSYARNLDKVRSSAGALNTAYREQTTGLGATAFTMDQLRVRVEVMAQRLGDQLAPAFNRLLTALEPVIASISNAITTFSLMSKEQQSYIVGAIALTAALGPMTKLFSGLVTVVSTLITGFKAIISIFSLLSIKVIAITAAIAGVAVGIIYLRDNWRAATERMDMAWNQFKNNVISGVQSLLQSFLMLNKTYPKLAALGAKITPAEINAEALEGYVAQLENLKAVIPDEKDLTPFKSFADSFSGLAGGLIQKAKQVAESFSSMFSGGGVGAPKLNAAPAATGRPAVDPTQIQTVKGEMFNRQELDKSLNYYKAVAGEMQTVTVDMNQVIAQSMADTFTSLGEGIGNMISGVSSSANVLDAILLSMADFAKQLGRMIIAVGLASDALQKSFADPYAAIAAGTALIAAGTIAKNKLQKGPEAPKLANGGLAFGPTMAMVGDNPNARSNPEVIAPLNKLKDLMGTSGGVIHNVIQLDGKTLYDGLNRYETRRDRTRG